MTLKSGTHLGRYEILSPIGAGGMGEVYKARDTRLDRTVAIKVLPAHLSDRPDLRERFEREAKTISSLNHPHICVLYDIGRAEIEDRKSQIADGVEGRKSQVDYLVMEYLEGETVADRLKKGPLPLDSVLRYAIEISDALDKAHRQGFTHRDIKPANIMLTKSGSKLLDFGLAKWRQGNWGLAPYFPQSSADDQKESAGNKVPVPNFPSVPTLRDSLTIDGAILGTLQYMAPEQVERKTDEIDARTDIFAFGALIYEMATGKKAFEGKSQASLIGAILKDNPPPVSSLQPVSPKLLDHVIRKCLAKEPDDRWQNAADLAAELKWIAEEGIQIAAVAPAIRKSRTRERWVWIAVTAVLLIVAAVAVFIPFFRSAPATPASITRLSLVLGPNDRLASLNQPALAFSPDGSRIAYVADRGEGPRLYLRSIDRGEAGGGHSRWGQE